MADGQTDQYGLGTEASIFRVAPFIWQNGGELVVTEQIGVPLRLAVDSRAAREAIEWFVALQTEHGVVPDALAEAAQDSESRFLDGSLAMFLNSRRGVPTYRQHRAASTGTWRRCRARSSPPGSSTPTPTAWPPRPRTRRRPGPSSSSPTRPRARPSWPSPVAPCPRSSTWPESEAFLDPAAKPANSAVFLETIPILREVPVMAGWVDVEELAGDELERAFYGQASVDEAIERHDHAHAALLRGRGGLRSPLRHTHRAHRLLGSASDRPRSAMRRNLQSYPMQGII